MYIDPNTKVHSTFQEAKEFHAKSDEFILFREKKRPSIADLAQGLRNVIVGEPGVGKTALLERIKGHLDKQGVRAEIVLLRTPDVTRRIDDFLAGGPADVPSALLLDALDEVRSIDFDSVLQKIESVAAAHPALPIYITARWVFISRFASYFPAYRFITLLPFSEGQVKEFLIRSRQSEADVINLLRRVFSFGHLRSILQIPRYLYYLNDYFHSHPINSVNELSRADLFEHFINSKLKLEDKKFNVDQGVINKRVLEKLALCMEIYQNNTIAKDDLATFFDDVASDLKMPIIANLQPFIDNTLLKLTGQEIDNIAFENTEFQEYLAAKEITRLPDPRKAAFSFAADAELQTIYPSWFNTLTFLVDLQPDLLEQLVEFSGLGSKEFTIVDDAFLSFLNKVNPKTQPLRLRRRLFRDTLMYHNFRLQWMPGEGVSAMAGFFDPSLEALLKTETEAAEKEKETKRYVPLGNIVFVVGYLFRTNAPIEKDYWRTKLIGYASETHENGVLQRHALWALEELGDASVIDALPTDMISRPDLIAQRFLALCREVAPNDPRCIGYFIEAIKHYSITVSVEARLGLYAIQTRAAIKLFLETFTGDSDFRQRFLDRGSPDEENRTLVRHIAAVLDDQIRALCMHALIYSLDEHIPYERSAFTSELWKALKAGIPDFVPKVVDLLTAGVNKRVHLFFAQGYFAQILEIDDVGPFIEKLKAIDEADYAISVMQLVKFSGRTDADEVYEAGRHELSDAYAQWEAARKVAKTLTDAKKERLEEFRTLLTPNPEKPDEYWTNVFQFYNQHAAELDEVMEGGDRERLKYLLNEFVLKIDPAKYDVSITEEPGGSRTTTLSWDIRIFGDAIIVAKHLHLEIGPFRQHLVNYIPFAWDSELKAVFTLVGEISPTEMAGVIDIYAKDESDITRYQPGSFVEAVEQYHLTAAVPILRAFVQKEGYDIHTRTKALNVGESLASDGVYLKDVFDRYRSSVGDEQQLAEAANALLITSHDNEEAIGWRLNEVAKGALPFKRASGAHYVGPLEQEMRGRQFAQPLVQLKYAGHEDEYLRLLDVAADLWQKGQQFYEYSDYLQSIVLSYFENLKEKGSYQPLHRLEDKIGTLQNREGGNWMASRLAAVRRAYMASLGKPANIAEAIRKYNDARRFDNKKITNSADLFRHLQQAIDSDLRQWIEGEGAYRFVFAREKYKPGRQAYEDLIQKTIKSQLQFILAKRGFQQIEFTREPQLLDAKRIDFLIKYGFAGPVGIELKLTSNKDMRGRIENSESYKSMVRYMDGYAASHGIFLLFEDRRTNDVDKIKAAFSKIQNVWVKCFRSPSGSDRNRAIGRSRKKSTSKNKNRKGRNR